MMLAIGNRSIGPGSPPLVIAEMSGNHNRSIDRALAIVEAAARVGAHALKLQTYTADSMTLDIDKGEFFISDPSSPWNGTSLYQLYKKASTPFEWHAPLFERARALDIIPFSTPFDADAVDFLETLDCPAYKIASFENTDCQLIAKAASTGKPLIISTGMASIAELDDAVRSARSAGCRDLILLKCTSSYPADSENSNLLTIPHMRELFGCEVGLSDHTRGVGAAVAAVALGGTVVEKHFTLSREDGGVDAEFSLEPAEMCMLVEETHRAWSALGRVNYGPTSPEKPSLSFKRTLYIVKDLEAGAVLTRDNVRAIRPGLGLPPKYLDIILGRHVGRAVKRGTAVSWELLG